MYQQIEIAKKNAKKERESYWYLEEGESPKEERREYRRTQGSINLLYETIFGIKPQGESGTKTIFANATSF